MSQSADVENDAFPTLLPKTSFRRELRNRKASYLVAVERPRREEGAGPPHTQPHTNGARSYPSLGRLMSALPPWSRGRTSQAPHGELVAGFVGTWYVVDEAHLVSVGVRTEHRGLGVGELLLIASIEQATARMAAVVTLEVRPTNLVARNLYGKYGFEERGLRKSYYADNREDAIIMTTGPIQDPPYAALFKDLKRQHRSRWGEVELVLS